MQTVKVSKSELRERIQTNRDAHRAVYDKAMDGYRKAVVAFFETQLKRAQDGKQFVTYFREACPSDHTADYDNVLDMLDMSVDGEISLSQQEFRQYVRDDWGWKQEFTATASNYTR